MLHVHVGSQAALLRPATLGPPPAQTPGAPATYPSSLTFAHVRFSGVQALDLQPHLGDEVGRGGGLRQIIVLEKKDDGMFNAGPRPPGACTASNSDPCAL